MTTASPEPAVQTAQPKKKPRHDPLRAVAEARFNEHKKQQFLDRRNAAKLTFQAVLERAKSMSDAKGVVLLPSDYCLVEVIAAGIIKHPVRLDGDLLMVMVDGKKDHVCGRVAFNNSGSITGMVMKHITTYGMHKRVRVFQLLVTGCGVQESPWHPETKDWHLLTHKNTPGFPRRVL